MAVGPVQLVVLGFPNPDFHGEIIAELERLRESDTVRVIDSLVVYKDADGALAVEHLSNLTQEEAVELGSVIGALIGLGVEGEEGFAKGAAAGAEAAADGVQVFDDADAWDVLEDIPNGSAAALILLEHQWAVPLRDAVLRAGGRTPVRRLHQPARPGRDRNPVGGGGQGTARGRNGWRCEVLICARHPRGGSTSMFGSRRVARRTGRRTARRVSRRR
nr:hypothetical protein GCM10020092_080560 [Actinoplanes digitatis]